ncbi:MAG TPA: GDSL-type esterase/lipase family protein [Steroidobacteraceae bacterium]|nr:GDSL-type esterase/lipase family protein [Steroidobacteraceae bacterium]
MPHFPISRILVPLVLGASGAAALGGYALGRDGCAGAFEAYRDVRARVLAHQSAQPSDGTLLLIGSSTLERLSPGRLKVPATNLALAGDTIADVLDRLPSAGALERSGGVVLLVGYNDLKAGVEPAAALENYERLLNRLDDAPLTVCVTVQPLSPAARKADATLDRKIAAFNAGLRDRCSDGPRRVLADLAEQLGLADAVHASEYYVDEIHLSPRGYQVLTAALLAAIQRSGLRA